MIYECIILAARRDVLVTAVAVAAVAANLILLFPQAREFRLGQAFGRPLLVHFHICGFLLILIIRGG